MNQLSPNGGRAPVVFTKDGHVFASSLDIAEFFEKEHRNVLRDIESLISQEPACALNFEQASRDVPMPRGGARTERFFNMTRDGFTLLAMGFTGTKALQWKLRYIEAFNQMEATIRNASIDVMDALSNPATLRTLLANYSEKAEALQAKVDDLMPSAIALDRIAATDGSMSVTEAAKTLQLQPKALFTWLRTHAWVYRRPGAAADLAYQDKLQAGLLEHKATTVTRSDGSDKTVTQVRVTPKGLTRLAKEFAN